MDDLEKEIKALTEKIEDLKKRFPAHSVKPWMVEELENLEEELERLRDLFAKTRSPVH